MAFVVFRTVSPTNGPWFVMLIVTVWETLPSVDSVKLPPPCTELLLLRVVPLPPVLAVVTAAVAIDQLLSERPNPKGITACGNASFFECFPMFVPSLSW